MLCHSQNRTLPEIAMLCLSEAHSVARRADFLADLLARFYIHPTQNRALCVRSVHFAAVSAFSIIAVGAPRTQATAQTRGAASEWYANGRDDGLTRYSPLTQITPENVKRLVVAWTYHTG